MRPRQHLRPRTVHAQFRRRHPRRRSLVQQTARVVPGRREEGTNRTAGMTRGKYVTSQPAALYRIIRPEMKVKCAFSTNGTWCALKLGTQNTGYSARTNSLSS